ncbi:beta-1,3-galactosyltransferase pvg3-like [Ananas comosus]|uniref:Hexosyltransferase n=1 Tax=Ananas comosus TaxID=4615 RepID=A0A6P5GE77_ANACO|nr:beta-1,3-galactosyltransferase pvg3-like [Ananas comosus]
MFAWKQSPSCIALLALPLALFALATVVFYPRDFGLPLTFTSCGSSSSSAGGISAAPVQPEFRLLVGIITRPEYYERRHLLRMVYSLQQSDNNFAAHVDVRFVFCNLSTEEQAVFVALEIMCYDDIIILNCTENMDNGKTYNYFSSLPTLFDGDAKYDYVMKTDDDAFFRLPSLIESLRDKPRSDVYYGLQMPCDKENFFPFPPFMSGMGYILSWDLVEWIATSETAREDTTGPEDMWTGRWLNMAGRASNRFDNAPAMYDYRGTSPATCFRHDFVPETIAVHHLIDNARWTDALTYFNFTKGLKSSKQYHIP